MALVPGTDASKTQEVEIEILGKMYPAKRIAIPFL